jgi:signal transduction histidine kinase
VPFHGRVTDTVDSRLPSRRVWELSYLVTFPVTIVVIMLAPGELAHRLGSAGLVGAIGVGYAAMRHRLDAYGPHARRHWGFAFNLGALAAFAVAVGLEFWAGVLLTALCPMAYLTVGMAWGHGFVVMLGLAPSVGELARSGDLRTTMTGTLPWSLATIAFSVVIASSIERAERRSAQRAALVAELRATREEAARLAREAGAADERGRLASDLHDTVAQGLSSIAMLVQAADRTLASDPRVARQHLATAARALRENLQETRALVGVLGPGPVVGSTLVDALRRLSLTTAPPGPEVAFEVVGAVRPLTTDVEVALLRVAQESLANVRRHAAATRASIALEFSAGTVELRVRDDGRGFDVTAPVAGYGVAGMRERMRRVGGELDLHSGPDGTRVRAVAAA